jgi:hypothetical protein
MENQTSLNSNNMQEPMDSADEAMDDDKDYHAYRCPICKEPFNMFVKHVCKPDIRPKEGDIRELDEW